ncbi:MAG: putative LPS assembly protein LptD [Brumimicrobium sp.]
MSKKYSIKHFFVVSLLIILLTPAIYAQSEGDTLEKKRIYREDDSMESTTYYSCRDSITADLKSDKISLYGEAEVKYDGIVLTADLIEMDTDKKEVYAVYTLDEEGNRVGIPKFEEGAESFTAASIRYNFETEKGYIEELKTQQEEMYLHMGVAKRHTNEQIHFTQGKFTTCELDEPHFHFQLSKAVMVPEERIATGPMNLWVKGIPTPLGLPYSVIPTKDKETAGLMFPMVVPASQFGFGFQDLGYYFPLEKSDNVQTTFYGSFYSQGTFEIRNQTDYKKRYKYTGNLNLGYGSFKQPFPADTARGQKITVQWNHRQEAKANPYWNFNSRVNFLSDNNGQTTLDPISDQYFQNNFNSDINLTRSFPGKPVTMGLKTALKQNSVSGNMDLDLPTLNVNVNRFFPLKALRKNNVGSEKWYEKLGMTYSLEAKNRGVIADTLLQQRRFDLMQNQFQNGIRHQAGMNYPIQLFNQIVTMNSSVNYNLRMNFQSIERSYDPVQDKQVIDTLRDMGLSQDVSGNLDFSTNLYAYYSFIGSPDMKMRHVMTPRVSFTYKPNLSSFVTDNVGPNGEEISYSPYERSLYRESVGREVGQISYSLNNTFELKSPNRKDSLEEFKKTRIIDALSLSGNYDVFKDSMKLSDVSLQMRVSPLPALSFVSRGSFSPYAWKESNGRSYDEFAINNNQSLGRFVSANVSTTFTFASKKSKEKIRENQQEISEVWGGDFQYYSMNPHEIIDFDIPWKVNVTHTWYLNRNTDSAAYQNERYNKTQNISLTGDVSFTERWKLGINSNYDISKGELTQTRLSLNRDMHCWQLAFFWTPVGGQQSFLVRFNATSALFQSAKLELRKPPEFL